MLRKSKRTKKIGGRWNAIALIIVVFMVFFTVQLMPSVATTTNADSNSDATSKIISDPLLSEEMQYLEPFHTNEKGGHASRTDNKRIYESLPHAMQALTVLLERNRTESLNESILSEARDIISFSASHFLDPYVRDRRAFVSFYSRDLGEESFPRAPRRSIDQVAMASALQALLDVLPESDEDYTDLSSILEGSLMFLKEYLTDDEFFGWYRAAIPLNLSHFTIDTSKLAMDQLLIAWLYFISTPRFKGFVGTEFQQHVRELVDFFLDNWTSEEGGLSFAGDKTGSNQLRLYGADVNALWGIVLLHSYHQFGNETYLQAAVKSFNFLWKYFWDLGVGGLFSKVSEELDLASRSKDLVGNGLFMLLAKELVDISPENTTYRNILVKSFNRWNQWFKIETSDGKIVRASTVDRQGQPSSVATYFDNVLSFLVRMQLPHFLEIQHPTTQLLGLPIQLQFRLHRSLTFPLVLQVVAPSLLDEPLNVTLTGENEMTVEFSAKASSKADVHQITVRLLFDSLLLDEVTFVIQLGGNVFIPNSLLLFIGSGVFVTLVIVLRYPPQFLIKWQEWLMQESGDAGESAEKTSEENSEDFKREENDSRVNDDSS